MPERSSRPEQYIAPSDVAPTVKPAAFDSPEQRLRQREALRTTLDSMEQVNPDREGFEPHHKLILSEPALDELVVVLETPDPSFFANSTSEVSELDNEEVLSRVKRGITTDSFDPTAAQELLLWAHAGPKERVETIEDAIAQGLQERQKVSLPLLTFLAELNSEASSVLINDNLGYVLEEHGDWLRNSELIDQLTVLNRLDNKQGHFALHKIMDFFERFMMSVQDHIEDELEREHDHYPSSFMELWNWAKREQKNSSNYLVEQHLNDLVELRFMYDSPRPDKIAGMPGGASDQSIYEYNRLIESYTNRVKLGIRHGFPAQNPVFKLSPGYVGEYNNGRLVSVYAEPPASQDFVEHEKQYAKDNNPEDEYIYEELNAPLKLPVRMRDPSNQLKKLEFIWGFKDRLEKSGRTFYFDLSRIDIAQFHQLVVAEILTWNERYRQAAHNTSEIAPQLTKQDYRAKLFPLGNPTSEQEYDYEYLMSTGMRQRILDDFGVELSNYPFWVQRNFLSFLERVPVAQVETVQKTIKQFGENALRTFVSLEEDKGNAERIIHIAEHLSPEIAQKIFGRYAELVDATTTNTEQLEQNLQSDKTLNRAELETTTKHILRKAQEVLVVAATAGELSEEILKKLERFSADNIIFSSLCTTLFKGKDHANFSELKGVTLESIRGSELSSDDRTAMRAIAESNWQSFGELGKKVTSKFEQDFTSADAADFYILRKDNKIISFVRFDKTDENNHRYAGSFNVAPEIRGSGIGEAMIRETLNHEAEHRILDAVFHPKLSVNYKYIEQTGFVLTGAIPDYAETGETIFTAECDRVKNPEYLTRTKTFEQILQDLNHDKGKTIDQLVAQLHVTLLFDIDKKYEQDLENIQKILAAGYVGTRFLPHPENKNQRIMVFEKKK
jgi:ribosomal protein S18 acetylase RimI-like enzyme